MSGHPFTKPAGSDAEVFIQWKGTNLCMDFYCPCGAHGHVDEQFAYYVECEACGDVFELGTQVIVKRADPAVKNGMDSVVTAHVEVMS